MNTAKQPTQELLKVFDTATTEGKLVQLNEEQATEFISYLQDESVLLKQARVVKMTKSNRDIAKIFPKGNFLYPGTKTSVDTSKDAEVGSDIVTLNTKLVRGNFIIFEDDLQDNIEGENFTQTMLRLAARKMGNELELAGIYSRKRDNPVTVNEMFNGLKFLAKTKGNVVNATDTGLFADRLIKKDKFKKAIKSVKAQYIKNAQFFMSSNAVIDYADLYDTVADASVRAALKNSILGRPYNEVSLMKDDEAVLVSGGISTTADGGNAAGSTVEVASGTGITAGKVFAVNYGTATEQIFTVNSISTTTITTVEPLLYAIEDGDTIKEVTLDGTDAVLTDPKNFIYGMQTNEDFSFEIERIAGVGWRYHFKARIDFQIENEEAICLIEGLEIE
jgi:HK97 family phage major capsid protein